MEKRQTISSLNAGVILSLAFIFDCWSLLFGLLAVVPIIGIAGTFMVWAGSWIWFGILMFWLFLMGSKTRQIRKRIITLTALEISSLLLSIVPFIGGIIDTVLMFTETVLLFLLIHAVNKEDEEYNKAQGLA